MNSQCKVELPTALENQVRELAAQANVTRMVALRAFLEVGITGLELEVGRKPSKPSGRRGPVKSGRLPSDLAWKLANLAKVRGEPEAATYRHALEIGIEGVESAGGLVKMLGEIEQIKRDGLRVRFGGALCQ
jgi:predicted DNA-binding protein